MTYIQGSIPVTGFIGPTDSEDTYAVTDAIYGIDGYRSLSSTTARNAISTERRREGMLVYTQSDQNIWQLLPGPWSGMDSDWKLFISSAVTASLSANTGFLALSGGTMYGDITMSSTTVIKSSNGGGQINLDYGGTAGNIVISNDNGGYGLSAIDLNPDSVYIQGGGTGYILVSSGLTSIVSAPGVIAVRDTQSSFTLPFWPGILLSDNSGFTTFSPDETVTAISSQSTTFNSGVSRSVAVGGAGMNVAQSNSLYAQNARLAENGGRIYSAGTPLENIFLVGEIVTGTTNYITKWNSPTGLTISVIYDNGSNVGVGTINPLEKLHVSGGTIRINDTGLTYGSGKLAVSDANGSISFSSITSLGLTTSAGTVNKYTTSTTLTAGTISYITHGLGLTDASDIVVQIWSGNNLTLGAEVSAVTINQIAVTTSVSGTYKIVVLG